MRKSGFTISGAGFAKQGQAIADSLKQAIADQAIVIATDAASLAPVDTGALRNSIYYSTYDQGSGYGAAVSTAALANPKAKMLPEIKPRGPYQASVGIAVHYWYFVEYGTSNPNYPRQPFINPAIEQNRAAFYEACRQAMQNPQSAGFSVVQRAVGSFTSTSYLRRSRRTP